ncbi:hypothetical protein [Ktedonospora formicarum]|uniref:hypothetical protein n=1 Tax=Ktedonospora formicarum TaxID=2778364 RepID=UPI001C68DD0A|nr:hypothetical protein [Ktedonospora formicarum]
MERPTRSEGVVAGSTLFYRLDAQEGSISVDSPAWYSWLERAHSFSFRGDEGTFTAHKARASNQRGGWYWYAYCHRDGHFFRSYLGASKKLTLERMRDTLGLFVSQSSARSHDSSISAGSRTRLESQTRAVAFRQGRRLQPYTEQEPVPFPYSLSEYPQSALLATKFHIPRLPVHHIARSRLQGTLDEVVEARLTLVSAPAGSGKTTLLAAWARTTTVPVAWLSLEAADDDPQRFLSYVLAALSSLNTSVNKLDAVPLQILLKERPRLMYSGRRRQRGGRSCRALARAGCHRRRTLMQEGKRKDDWKNAVAGRIEHASRDRGRFRVHL